MPTDPILAAFERLAHLDGSAPIVVDRERSATRSDVAAAGGVVAEKLRAHHVPARGYVLIACVNGAGFLAALVGARRAGLVPVLADWASPPAERARVAATLSVAAQITCDEVFPEVRTLFASKRAAPIRPKHRPEPTS